MTDDTARISEREGYVPAADQAHEHCAGCRGTDYLHRPCRGLDVVPRRLAATPANPGGLDVAKDEVIAALLELNKFATWSALNRPEYPRLRDALAEYVRLSKVADHDR